MIVINARFLTQPITGVQRFAIEISKLLKLKLNGEVCFVTCPGIIHKDLAVELDAKVIGINKSHIWEQIDLHLFLLKKSKPILISFGYTGPLFYKKQIISIHDVAFKLFKNTFSKSFSLVYNFLVPRLAKKCLHIITVSNTAKEELCFELDLPSEKITVVYNGISPIFKLKNKFLLKNHHKPYILTVSSHHPRKNYDRLLKAFNGIGTNNVDLYVVGNFIDHFNSDNDIKQISNVKYLTNVSDKQLLVYYQNAEFFIFPSLYEGFGIPVIEAMSQNLRCVISDIPVFREIGDESVTYIDPKSVKSIQMGIEKTLNSPKEEIEYSKLLKFNWEDSSDKVINIMKNFYNL